MRSWKEGLKVEVEGRRGIGKGRREGRRANMKGKGGVYTVEIEVDGGESGRPRVVRRCEGREWPEEKVEVE